MENEVRTVRPGTRLTEVEAQLLRGRVSGLPVVDGGKLVGMITRSDFLKHAQSIHSQLDGAFSAYGDAGEEPTQRELESQQAQLAVAVAADRAIATVGDAMTSDVISVAPETSLVDVARLMTEHRIHRLPVVENGMLRGVVSTLDLARLVADGQLA